MGCHALLQGIFPTQGSNLHLLGLLHWQVDSFPLMPPGKLLQAAWCGQKKNKEEVEPSSRGLCGLFWCPPLQEPNSLGYYNATTPAPFTTITPLSIYPKPSGTTFQ